MRTVNQNPIDIVDTKAVRFPSANEAAHHLPSYVTTLRCVVIKPFHWRPERWQRGVAIPLGEMRIVQPGDEIDALEFVARDLEARGRVRVSTS